jgi:hypothetical protein
MVNRVFARPTLPVGTSLFAGLFQASFHLVDCRAGAAPDAIWYELGSQLLNGAEPAADLQTVEFTCPSNTPTTICGVPLSDSEQCLVVSLESAPGQNEAIATAVAVRPLLVTEYGAGGADGSAGGAASDAGAASDDGAGGALATGEGGSRTPEAGGQPGSGVAGDGQAPDGQGGAEKDPEASGDGDGDCGCRVVGQRRGGIALSLLIAALLAVARRRRA